MEFYFIISGCLDQKTVEAKSYDPIFSVFQGDLEIPMFAQFYDEQKIDAQKTIE